MEFGQIYSTYFKSVYLYAMQLSGNKHIAKEITSDTFYKAIHSIDKFRGDCDMRVWLCQIAKNPAFTEYTLELWSAHLEDDEGWIWVYYSSETFDNKGVSICGSWRIPSLWKVEKNDSGEWTVVAIREHP